MSPSPDSSSSAREIGKFAFIAGGIWTAFLFISLAMGLREQALDAIKQTEREAETLVDMDLSFRNWVIDSGGVYVSSGAGASAGPLLRARDGEAKTDSGRKLIRLNHADTLRQLSAARAKKGLPSAHLTSLLPKDPADAPDEWERAALADFERGKTQAASRYDLTSVHYIRAFRLEPSCLPCHNAAESPGGIRGAISIEVPLQHLTATGSKLRRYWIVGHTLIWLAGLFGILLASKHLKRAEVDLGASEDRYRKLFETSQDALMTLAPPAWAFTSGNAATLAMFRAGSEAEFLARGPQDLSPERQPDGRLSSEKAREMIMLAMARGANLFEWTHRRVSGEEFPADVLLTRMSSGSGAFLQATVRDISERKAEQARREALLEELRETLAQVKYLSGLIPICASCKKIRNDKGDWETVEHYVAEHSDAKFSHGICPDCGKKLYGKYYEEKPKEEK